MGAAPKAGYTEGVTDSTHVGNVYVFSIMAFSCLYPRPVSLPARRSSPFSVLLNAGWYECF